MVAGSGASIFPLWAEISQSGFGEVAVQLKKLTTVEHIASKTKQNHFATICRYEVVLTLNVIQYTSSITARTQY